MLPACGLWGKTLLAAVMAGLLLYLTSHLLLHKGQCWELVFLVPALYTLFKSLGLLVRIKFQAKSYSYPHPLLTVYMFFYPMVFNQNSHRVMVNGLYL